MRISEINKDYLLAFINESNGIIRFEGNLSLIHELEIPPEDRDALFNMVLELYNEGKIVLTDMLWIFSNEQAKDRKYTKYVDNK